MHLLISPLTWALSGLLILAWQRTRAWRAVRWAATLVSACAILLMTPLGANALLQGLEASANQAQDAPTCERVPGLKPRLAILLGGGFERPARNSDDVAALSLASVARAAHAVELYRQGGYERLLIAGGASEGAAEAEVLATWVVQMGLPASVVTRESESMTTWENARHVARQRGDASGPVLLVTTAMHMRRARLAFEAAGLTVCAAPTQWLHIGPVPSPAYFWPQRSALDKAERALHEWVGLLAYRFRQAG